MVPSLLIALVAGIGIAAAAGLRAFLPLFVLGLAGRFGGLDLHDKFDWLTTDVALVALGVATLVEILADKIPVVDHVLDVAATFVRPVTATLAAYAFLVNWPTPWGQIIALLLGAGAFALHAAKSQLRIGSTLATAGAGNPLLSVLEDGAAFALIVAVLLAPFVALFGIFLLLALMVRRRTRAVA